MMKDGRRLRYTETTVASYNVGSRKRSSSAGNEKMERAGGR